MLHAIPYHTIPNQTNTESIWIKNDTASWTKKHTNIVADLIEPFSTIRYNFPEIHCSRRIAHDINECTEFKKLAKCLNNRKNPVAFVFLLAVFVTIPFCYHALLVPFYSYIFGTFFLFLMIFQLFFFLSDLYEILIATFA